MPDGTPETVGPYEIVREVGRGGMGIVRLAHDPVLDRRVAIKSLPEHFADDPDRMVRFEREAKALAQLNHPNVAGIYGVEEHAGHRYLILEFVDGPTLAERLEAGPLPLDEALEIGAAIAAGIEAAHDAGVVHRDLKPDNIKVNDDGAVKVLDFGLAKSTGSMPGSTAAADAATIAAPPAVPTTTPGAVLGTAPYMSPEQARGRSVDKRTDIWSFGVVLYEMLTGVGPFFGETATDSIAAILHKDVDMALLPAETPPMVRHVLERCLERERKQRYRDIGDVRIELLRVRSQPPPTPPAPRGPGRRAVALGAIGLAIVAATTTWLLKPGPPPVMPPVFDAEVALPAGDRLAHAYSCGLALSPDGTMLAFPVGAEPERPGLVIHDVPPREIMLRRLDEAEAVAVPGTEGGHQPVFSPDGARLAFVAGTDLKTVTLPGGAPTTVYDREVRGLTWCDDNTLVFIPGPDAGLHRIPETGGDVEILTTVDPTAGEIGHRLPHALPGGGLLFTARYGSEFGGRAHIWVVRPDGERQLVIEDGSDARYAAGHVIFVRRGALFAAPFDVGAYERTGPARPLRNRVAQSLYTPSSTYENHAGQFAIAPTGTLAFVPGDVFPEAPRSPAWIERDGSATPLDIESRGYLSTRVSPDGRQVLLSVFYTPTNAIWVHDLERGVTSAHNIDGASYWVCWGPEPEQITYMVTRADGTHAIAFNYVGAPEHEATTIDTPDGVELMIHGWTRDGVHLVAVGYGIDGSADLWVYDAQAGWRALFVTDAGEEHPDVSPDGRWLAYCSYASGRSELYVRPFLRDGRPIQVTDTGASGAAWSQNGRELFYYRTTTEGDVTTRRQMAIPFDASGDRPAFDAPETLFEHDFFATQPIRSYDVTEDGRFLFKQHPPEAHRRGVLRRFHPDRIRVIQGWAGVLKNDAE